MYRLCANYHPVISAIHFEVIGSLTPIFSSWSLAPLIIQSPVVATNTDKNWICFGMDEVIDNVWRSLGLSMVNHSIDTLQWRHHEHNNVSNHQPIDCLLSRSGADQRKYQSSASLAVVKGIHRWPVNCPHKRPGKCFHLMTSSCYEILTVPLLSLRYDTLLKVVLDMLYLDNFCGYLWSLIMIATRYKSWLKRG